MSAAKRRIADILCPIADLIYPPFCVSCQTLLPYTLHAKERVPLCPDCAKKWEIEKHTLCPICSKPHIDCECGVPGLAGQVDRFLHLARYSDWDSVARRMTLTAKDESYFALFELIADELAHLLRRRGVPTAGALICYIPRNPAKARDRGVDQGKKTAKLLAKKLSVPCVAAICRNRAAEQKGLDAAARRINAQRAFSLRKGAAEKVRGRSVILYDDVITSGASMTRAVELLRSAGAKKITVLTFAKTVYAPKSKKSASKSPDLPDFSDPEDDFADFSLDDDG